MPPKTATPAITESATAITAAAANETKPFRVTWRSPVRTTRLMLSQSIRLAYRAPASSRTSCPSSIVMTRERSASTTPGLWVVRMTVVPKSLTRLKI